MYRKDCDIKTYNAICRKYPNLTVSAEEDLNIERNAVKILRACWDDKNRYSNVIDISLVTGLSERQIFRYARNNKFPKRIARETN